MSLRLCAFLAIFQILNGLVLACKQDEVNNLPGRPANSAFKMYSGFLDGFYGGHKIHYVFVESQRDPVNDPVALWLNGGPGCSSLEGFFAENGPYKLLKDAKTLQPNDFSWNKMANMLYLESPVGVGYSYINGSTNIRTDDDRTTNDNFQAILEFFKRFPNLKKNEFFITGESYGGIYVPLLTKKVLAESDINMKGYLIVNGLLDYNTNYASMIFYLFYHGIISERVFLNFTSTCCNGSPNMKNCNIYSPVACREMFNYDTGPINFYNIYTKCEFDQKFVIGTEQVEAAIPCVDSSHVEKFLNDDKVKTALNIYDTPAKTTFRMCNIDLNSKNYKRVYKSTENVIRELVNKTRGFIINGDIDSVCNFLGNEWSFDNLGLHITEPWKYYTVNKQVAGYTKAANSLRFATVKGAGHMIPEDKPQEALRLFERFLNNQDLSEKK